ncbi:hypothetical protein JVT61DRAFT_2815 [Boletus reticuloceps]|uniref:DUF6534 domain-containing protein n=1 Tax=Boletus reticuloceps TaxID=495285 RepID=A0A8I2YS12_9AGAM|nr:hypothetical protein JVT61DRAFT_2815 [Boletus reticuloceps]
MSTSFYAIACMQTFFYYVRYENDPLRTKILVAVLWALNTIHEALCVAGAYKYIMGGIVSPYSFVVANPELVVSPALHVLRGPWLRYQRKVFLFIESTYVCFNIRVIFLFTHSSSVSGKNIILPLIWIVLAPVELVCCTIYVAKSLYTTNGVVKVVAISTINSGSFVTQASLALSFAAAADVLIAISMTFLLVRQRTATKFASTAHILQRLIVFSVNTGTWTATFALLTIILLNVFPNNWICTVTMIPLCAVYCNTLLANLNARAYVMGTETTYNVDLDLFSGPSSRPPDTTQGDEQHGKAEIVFAAHSALSKTTEVATFSDANRSSPEMNVTV